MIIGQKENQEFTTETADAAETTFSYFEKRLFKSFFSTCCPENLSPAEKKKQSLERISSAIRYFGIETARSLLINDEYFCKSFRTEKSKSPAKKIYILITGSRTTEGDFGITLLIQPANEEQGLLQMAHISFMVTDGTITITGLHGQPSSFNKAALNRFGRDILNDNRLHEQFKSALEGTNPFNFLVGLLIEICEAKGITRLRGMETDQLPYPGKHSIKHKFAGTYYSCGMRPSCKDGIFETNLDSPGQKEKCFRRITGKKSGIKEKRELVFRRALKTLQEACPAILDPLPEKHRKTTAKSLKKCFNQDFT